MFNFTVFDLCQETHVNIKFGTIVILQSQIQDFQVYVPPHRIEFSFLSCLSGNVFILPTSGSEQKDGPAHLVAQESVRLLASVL